MGNPLKGELDFEAGGKRYVFVLGTYALAALQRRSGMSTMKFFNRATSDWGMDDVLGVFHCGLMRNHPSLTEAEVSDIIDELGQQRVSEIISEGIKLVFPSPEGRSARPTRLKSA